MGDEFGIAAWSSTARPATSSSMASMPAYDPNSFSDGIGRTEWRMLSEDDHRPLLNKVTQGALPARLDHQADEHHGAARSRRRSRPRRSIAGGGYRVGNRFFHCWKRGGHGGVNMHRAVAQSCDIYFYAMAHRGTAINRIADMARRVGLGEKFDLPVASQRFGTVPDAAWKLRKYKETMGDLRQRQRGDRPGLCAGQPAAIGGDGGAHSDRARSSSRGCWQAIRSRRRRWAGAPSISKWSTTR